MLMKTQRERVGNQTGEIQLQNLRKHYGSAVAVDDVSLAIRPGEFISFLGPSGSGKTTTLMMIAGFEQPDSGKVTLDGKDITKLPAHRRELGIIFQNYALFPHMTVEENVAYPLRMRRVASSEVKARVKAVLDQVHLTSFASRYPHQMSGGQQQRVAIARALVFDPPVLLLDEPLGALDKKLRQHLRSEIMTLHREVGKTMIFVTHDQEEALAMSDRVAVMNEGRIRQVATPEEIYRKPADLFVAGFVGEVNFISTTISKGRCLGPNAEMLPAPIWAGSDAKATLCVRPEHIKFSRTGDAARTPQVRVTDITFVGDATIVEVRNEAGLCLTSKVLNASTADLPEVGELCFATWDADNASVLTR